MIAEPMLSSSVRALGKPNPRLLEEHLDKLIALCRWSDEGVIEPYFERLRSEVCDACDYEADCLGSCPLKTLLPLAVAAIDMCGQQQQSLADLLSWDDAEMPESD